MIRATRTSIEEFKESMLWLDIQDELVELSRRATIEYDLVGEPRIDDTGHKIVPNTSETLIHLGDIKGRRKAIQYFLSIPDLLLQSLELDPKEDEQDQ